MKYKSSIRFFVFALTVIHIAWPISVGGMLFRISLPWISSVAAILTVISLSPRFVALIHHRPVKFHSRYPAIFLDRMDRLSPWDFTGEAGEGLLAEEFTPIDRSF